ncbi:FdhF/YdeP family oxidoreductase [Bacteroidia bacterium]|nr:FdhF/YdeP family oxidoreductase [bacterium]MDC0105372.1 FdhF/YdeP family oxidoreductase [Bacteroidia bacterium]
MSTQKIEIENFDFTGLILKEPKKKAVGLPAIISSVKQAAKYMDPIDAFKLSLKINQKGGFDCPGCAWPDPDDDRSALGEYCENGMKAIAEEATKKSVTAAFFKKHSVAEISKFSDFKMGKLGRLTEPMVLREGATHYEPIAWEDAFKLVAKELNALDSPDEAIFYTSGRTSNEAAYLYQLFIRSYGTNNLPDCSNMCHESSGVGLSHTLGIGKGSVTLNDLHEAEVIMIMGQNPGTNHPRMLGALEKCKQNGGKIITVNPLPEAGLLNFTDPQSPIKMIQGGTLLTDVFAPVKVNGDVAFLKAIMLKLEKMEEANPGNILDWDFIKEHTHGFDNFLADLKKEDVQHAISESGVEESIIIEVAEMMATNDKIIICWAMGLTQQKNGVGNIQEVVNLLLMRGAIGKPGAGTCPVRGHSNVQGDRTMGIWESPKEPFLAALDRVHGIQAPREHGYHVVSAIEAMKAGRGKVFFAMGGNFLSASPDTHYTAYALQNTVLTVHVSTKLNRSHLVTGKQALILPCLGRTDKDVQADGEQFVSCENSMGVVQSSQGILTPPNVLLKSEVAIVAEMALATLSDSRVNWIGMAVNYDKIRDAIGQTIPGFENYNERVRKPGGFYLPNGARERVWDTETGKANFTTNAIPHNELKEGEYLMMTLRSHDQYNTTVYGLDDRYRGIYNERRIVMMNIKDIKARGWKEKQVVNLFSHFNGVKREALKFLIVPYPIPEGNVATYFPEANPLVPIDSFADKSHTPTSKLVIITINSVI